MHTTEALQKLLQQYRKELKMNYNAVPLRDDYYESLLNFRCPAKYERSDIALTMIDLMEDMLESEGPTDKFHRFLGFLQGIIWVIGMRSINEMRDENRPIFKGGDD